MSNVLGSFPGTHHELYDLQKAIEHNCTCAHHPPEATDQLCPAHQMLRDVRLLNHLVFALRLRETFLEPEFKEDC